MAGRPRKPTALRILDGDKDKARYNDSEPCPDALSGMPQPEVPLGPDGMRMWDELGPKLLRLGLLTEIDTHEFTMLCKAWDGWCMRPSVEMTKVVSSLLTKFGCNPADRSKITGATNPQSSDPMERLLSSGGKP